MAEIKQNKPYNLFIRFEESVPLPFYLYPWIEKLHKIKFLPNAKLCIVNFLLKLSREWTEHSPEDLNNFQSK